MAFELTENYDIPIPGDPMNQLQLKAAFVRVDEALAGPSFLTAGPAWSASDVLSGEDAGKHLNMGYDAAGSVAYIRSVDSGTAFTDLHLAGLGVSLWSATGSGDVVETLTARGGTVRIAGTTSAPSLSAVSGFTFFEGSSTIELNLGVYATAPYGVWLQTKNTVGGGGDGTAYPLYLNPLGGFVGIWTESPTCPVQLGENWCDDTYIPNGTPTDLSTNAMTVFGDDSAPGGPQGISSFVRSLNIAGSTQAFTAFAFANNAASRGAWPWYSEGHRMTSLDYSYGLGEAACVNRHNSVNPINPYNVPGESVVGLQLTCGNSKPSSAGLQYSASSAILLTLNAGTGQTNCKGFQAGITFRSDALDPTVNTIPHAIELAANTASHAIVWYSDATTMPWKVYSNATAGTNSLILGNSTAVFNSKLEVKAGTGTSDAAVDALAVSTTNTTFTTKGRVGVNYDACFISQNAAFNGSAWVADNVSRATAAIKLEAASANGNITFYTSSTNNAGQGTDRLVVTSAGDFMPSFNYVCNLGSFTKQYLTLHCAELHVGTFVAQESIATIGGNIVVAPTTVLTTDLTNVATSVVVKHNEMASGDTVIFKANNSIEFVAITSAPSGSGPYTYTATRNLDGSGANAWNAGDAMVNTGTTGDGFIDIYSLHGIKTSSQVGPTITVNVRNSTTYNDWTEHAAFGNLNGLYGYVATAYGVALGKFADNFEHVTVDSTNGLRMIRRVSGVSVVNSQWDTSGNVKIGTNVSAAATTNLLISNATQTYNSESLIAGDVLIGDNTSASNLGNIKITAAGVLKFRRGVTDYITIDATEAQFTNLIKMKGASAAIAIGATPPTSASAGTGIWMDSTGIYALSGGSPLFTLKSNGGALQTTAILSQFADCIIRATAPDSGAGGKSVNVMDATAFPAGGSQSVQFGLAAQNSTTASWAWLSPLSGAFLGLTIGGTAGAVPTVSAILDLNTTTGALLIPRMTTTQKNALTAANGMIVYDTTLGKFQGREAGAWVSFI